MSIKNSNDTSWDRTTTFRFVAQHLNHVLYSTLNYKNGSIVSVDMDVVGVMAAYAAITQTEYCIRLPDDGSLVIRNMLENF